MLIQRMSSFNNKKQQSMQTTNNRLNNINFKSIYTILDASSHACTKIDKILEEITKLLNGEGLITSYDLLGRREETTFVEKFERQKLNISRDIFAYEKNRTGAITKQNILPYDEVILSVPDIKDPVVKKTLDEAKVKYTKYPLSMEECKFLLFDISNKNVNDKHYWSFQSRLLKYFMKQRVQPYRYLKAMASKDGQVLEMEIRANNPSVETLMDHLKDNGIQHISISDKPKYLNY